MSAQTTQIIDRMTIGESREITHEAYTAGNIDYTKCSRDKAMCLSLAWIDFQSVAGRNPQHYQEIEATYKQYIRRIHERK